MNGVKEIRLAYPQDLIQTIHNYLTTKPHNEVEGLIYGLRHLGVQVEVQATIQQPATEEKTDG